MYISTSVSTATIAAVSLTVILVLSPAVKAGEVENPTDAQPDHHATGESSASKTLTMQEAIQLALSSSDPYLLEPGETAAAFDDRAISDAQLPDPQFRVNFANWPLDSFSYTQEPMTQFQVGVSQTFPKGKTLELNKKKRQAQAKGERFRQDLRRREIILDTRLTWLDLFYWENARGKVRDSRQAVAELIEVIQAIYATGRETSQDILRAELELSLLDDRLVEVDRQSAIARAKLARRIGVTAAQRKVMVTQPAMQHPSDIDILTDLLDRHPVAQLRATQVEIADRDVDIAGEQYKPGWAVNVGYGARGADRADFASVGVVMDVPLFTKNRQDKRVTAAKKTRQASRLSKDAIVLDLRRRLNASFADWQRLQERISLYRSVVLKRAKETTEASLTSYQSGVTDFAELVRARLAELDADLSLLRLTADRLKAQAQLIFLEGEDDE